jgi:L-ascorbate metabolism protein UlaG (beta-lactamase superfamily)
MPRAGHVRARFMGVTTILLDDGKTALLTDGFFSRPPLGRIIVRRLVSDARRIDAALEAAQVDRLAAVLVAHAHYDHAMDCAEVAIRTGALLVGSESVANIGRGAGIPENRLHVVGGGDTCPFDRFNVTIYRTIHSPDPKFCGEIDEPLSQPARVRDYREGGCLAFLVEHDGHKVLIHPSANMLSGMYVGVSADVVFLAIGMLSKEGHAFFERYWREVVVETGARLVIPVHWDDFRISLDEPLQPMPSLIDDVVQSMGWLQAAGEKDHVAIRCMPAFDPVDIFH